MDPAVRLASTVADPHVSQLLLPVEATPDQAQSEGELLARLVSFRGENPPLSYESLLSLARELVGLAAPAHRLPHLDEGPVAAILARTLWIIGELDTTDEQAVRLGPQDFARKLRSALPGADRELSTDAAWFHDRLLVTVCLHLLHHLIRRSPVLSDRMPERAHRIRQLIDLNDVEAVRGRPEPSAVDAEFETRYARSIAEQYNRVTIYGIDLPNPNTPDNWSLDATYLSLSAEFDNPDRSEEDGGSGEPVLPADRALGGHERVLLRGVAGSGKTTLVQWLAVSAARDVLPPELASLRGRIPLVLPVRRFAREGFPSPRRTSCGPCVIRWPTRRPTAGWPGSSPRSGGCCWSTASTRCPSPNGQRAAASAAPPDADLLGKLLPGHRPPLGRGGELAGRRGLRRAGTGAHEPRPGGRLHHRLAHRGRRRRGQGPPAAGRLPRPAPLLHPALPRTARPGDQPADDVRADLRPQPGPLRLTAAGAQGGCTRPRWRCSCNAATPSAASCTPTP